MKLVKTKTMFWLGHAGFVGFTATLILWLSPAMAADGVAAASSLPEGAIQWGFVAAAISTGLVGAGRRHCRRPTSAVPPSAQSPRSRKSSAVP